MLRYAIAYIIARDLPLLTEKREEPRGFASLPMDIVSIDTVESKLPTLSTLN